jgi:hypothetical protein
LDVGIDGESRVQNAHRSIPSGKSTKTMLATAPSIRPRPSVALALCGCATALPRSGDLIASRSRVTMDRHAGHSLY